MSEGRKGGREKNFAPEMKEKLHADSTASSCLPDLRKCELKMKAAIVTSRKRRAKVRFPVKIELKKAIRPAIMIKNLTKKKRADFAPCFLICLNARKVKSARIRILTVKV